jgi:hypothetical protein
MKKLLNSQGNNPPAAVFEVVVKGLTSDGI